MARFWKILISALVVIAVVLLIAAIVVDAKFNVIRSAPVLSHEMVAGENDTLRVLVRPGLANRFLAEHVAVDHGVGAGTLSRIMPYEAALLLSPDTASGDVGVTLFLNEQRLGPVIADLVKPAQLRSAYPFIQWDEKGFVRQGRGRMLMRGQMSLDRQILGIVQAEWGVVAPMTPMRVEDGHLIEVVLDNRGGQAFATLVSVYRSLNKGPDGFNPQALAQNIWLISSIRLTADLTGDDTANVHGVIKCNPAADDEDINTLAFLLSTMQGDIRKGISDALGGAAVEGGSTRDGLTITLDYTITGFTDFVVAQIKGNKAA